MRVLTSVVSLALLWASISFANDGKASKMVLKLDKSQVEAAQKSLASLKGIQKVTYDEKEGQLVIFYEKSKMGCCSQIHKALQGAGIKYTLVSNEEYPACTDKHEEEHTSTAMPTKGTKKKGCCKKESKSACSGHSM